MTKRLHVADVTVGSLMSRPYRRRARDSWG